MKLTFFKNEPQVYFENIRQFTTVSVVSRKLGQWYLDGKKVKGPPPKAIRWRTELKYPYVTLNDRWPVIYGNSKGVQRKMLMDKVDVPRTWFSPENITYPCLARPLRHSRGVHFHVLKNKSDLKSLPNKTWYFSEWIEKEKEYRVYVGGGKCLGGFDKPIEGHLTGHIAVTGSWGDLIEVPEDVADLSIKATETLGLDFSGVDVIVGEKPYICEINTAPMFVSKDVAELFFNYFKLWLQ